MELNKVTPTGRVKNLNSMEQPKMERLDDVHVGIWMAEDMVLVMRPAEARRMALRLYQMAKEAFPYEFRAWQGDSVEKLGNEDEIAGLAERLSRNSSRPTGL